MHLYLRTEEQDISHAVSSQTEGSPITVNVTQVLRHQPSPPSCPLRISGRLDIASPTVAVGKGADIVRLQLGIN